MKEAGIFKLDYVTNRFRFGQFISNQNGTSTEST